MAEAAQAIGAFAAGRDLVQGIGQRLDALGSGAQDALEALLRPLAALPAAATFAPFAALGDTAEQRSQDNPGAGKRAAARSQRSPARRSPAAPRQAQSLSLPATLTALPVALAGAGATLARAIGDAAAVAARRTATSPRPFTALGDAIHAPASGHGNALAVPAQAALLVGEWLAAWVEHSGAGQAPVGSIEDALAGRMTAPAEAVGALSVQALILAQLETLQRTPEPARGRVAVKPSLEAIAGGRPNGLPASTSGFSSGQVPASTSGFSPGQVPATTAGNGAAPRAPSRLLPDATVAPATPKSDPAAPADGGLADDPIEGLTRALVDQAWLRGVDLK